MARPLRIEYPGAFYHALNRGLERREIFRDKKDCEAFLHLKKSRRAPGIKKIYTCVESCCGGEG